MMAAVKTRSWSTYRSGWSRRLWKQCANDLPEKPEKMDDKTKLSLDDEAAIAQWGADYERLLTDTLVTPAEIHLGAGRQTSRLRRAASGRPPRGRAISRSR
jgi:hypothetical protein